MGRKRVRGEITAFLSLIFVLLLSFILAMTESASLQTAKNHRRADADLAIFSVFGEYQKELLESYEIFGVDGGYQRGDFEESNLIGRMHYYGTAGMEHEIRGIQLLTDNGAMPFREQVLSYMKDLYGIQAVQGILGMKETWEMQEIQGQNAKEQLEGVTDIPYEEGQENPLGNIVEIQESRFLQSVFPKDKTLSAKTIVTERLPSNRSLRTGRGTFPVNRAADGVLARALLGSYYLDKFSTATTEGEESVLSYEVEYLLEGKASDRENLEGTAKKLLLVRMGANYIHLLGDAQKQGEAGTFALAIATVAAMPAIAEGLKQVLLIAWAYGESIMDLRSLLSGRKVTLLKSSQDWQLPLSGLMSLGTAEDGREGKDMPGGLEYKEYLRMLLLLESEETCAMRALDLIEQNLNLAEEQSSFRADACVTKLELQSTVSLRKGITYEFPVYFAYQ